MKMFVIITLQNEQCQSPAFQGSKPPSPLNVCRRWFTAGPRFGVQNLFWSAGYNIIAIPLAAGVLAPLGIILSPVVGAVLMSLSTVIVAVNAQLLKKQMKV